MLAKLPAVIAQRQTIVLSRRPSRSSSSSNIPTCASMKVQQA
jgi:hypothetical protein